MTPAGDPPAGGPRRDTGPVDEATAAVFGVTVVLAAAVLVPLLLLTGPGAPHLATGFFFTAAAVATFWGVIYHTAAAATAAGGLAAGWVAAVTYASSGSVRWTSLSLLAIELGCILTAPAALALITRRRRLRPSAAAAIILAAALTPLLFTWHLGRALGRLTATGRLR